MEDIMQVKVEVSKKWKKEDIKKEIEKNEKGIIGYVVRWIDKGVG